MLIAKDVCSKSFSFKRMSEKSIQERRLRTPWRAQGDTELLRVSRILRHFSLSAQQVKDLVRPRRWGGRKPTERDILSLFVKHPNTTIVTWTLQNAQWINDVVLASHVGIGEDLGVLPCTPLKDDASYPVLQQHLHTGVRVAVTRNRDKKFGFVNGMEGTIQKQVGSALIVKTILGTEIIVHKETDEDGRRFYPIRVCYAVNLSKIQGETLEHLTLWLDCKSIAAAAYVAITRVRSLDSLLFLGWYTVKHFCPSPYASFAE